MRLLPLLAFTFPRCPADTTVDSSLEVLLLESWRWVIFPC
jgi:hypothetical protein